MKFLSALVSVSALTLLLAGCGAEKTDEQKVQEPSNVYPLTVTDALDHEVTIEDEPERIVSLSPSNTEILYALDLEEQIVGLTANDNYPEQVKEKPTVGDIDVNAEQLLALEPDLVLLHESAMYHVETLLDQLDAMDIDYYVVDDAQSFEAVYETFEDIGEITNRQLEATELIENIQQKVEQVKERVKDEQSKRAFIVVGTDPEIYVVGQNTFMNEMLTMLHVDNAVQQEGWLLYSAEDFVAANPDSIIFTYDGDDENILVNAAFKNMDAVKNEALTVVNGDTTSRQGPRIGEGLEEMAKAIYPDAFTN